MHFVNVTACLIKKKKKQAYSEIQEIKRVEAAEIQPYTFLVNRTRAIESRGHIDLENLTAHFTNMYYSPNCVIRTPLTAATQSNAWLSDPFEETEFNNVLKKLKCKKACLRLGGIPTGYRDSNMIVLYKGKGDRSLPSSYRGIALECCSYKLLSTMITKRISAKRVIRISCRRKTARRTVGFRKGRSTIDAFLQIHDRIIEQIRKDRGHLYVVFVDFRAAFDKVNRELVIQKLIEQFDVSGPILTLIATTGVQHLETDRRTLHIGGTNCPEYWNSTRRPN